MPGPSRGRGSARWRHHHRTGDSSPCSRRGRELKEIASRGSGRLLGHLGTRAPPSGGPMARFTVVEAAPRHSVRSRALGNEANPGPAIQASPFSGPGGEAGWLRPDGRLATQVRGKKRQRKSRDCLEEDEGPSF